MELNGPQKPWSIFGPKKESFAGYVPSIAKKTKELVSTYSVFWGCLNEIKRRT